MKRLQKILILTFIVCLTTNILAQEQVQNHQNEDVVDLSAQQQNNDNQGKQQDHHIDLLEDHEDLINEDIQGTNNQGSINPEDSFEDPQLMQEWEEYMHDFTPSDIITYKIDARSTEYLFQQVDYIPSYIRGAYFISSDQESSISFYIRDPNNKIIFKRKKAKEAIFYFNATVRGVYKIIFNNQYSLSSKSITFALHAGNSSETVVTAQDIDPLTQKLDYVAYQVDDIQSGAKFQGKRFNTYSQSIQNQGQKILILSIVETVLIVAAVAWQIYYIKKLLNNRRIV